MLLQAIPALLQALWDFLPEPEKDAPKTRRKTKPKPWAWKDVYGMAARAGVDPRPFSLRELAWMVDARARDEWDRTAWICLHIPSFGKRTRRFSDFHPILKAENKVEITELQAWAEEMSENMPEAESEEEGRQKFEAWCKRQDEEGEASNVRK